MELELVGTEEGVGSFSADIVARELGTGGLVVIENQFGSIDHDFERGLAPRRFVRNRSTATKTSSRRAV